MCDGQSIAKDRSSLMASSNRRRARGSGFASALEMLKQAIASLAPFALVVAATACGGASSSTTAEDEESSPRSSSADMAGDGVTDEQVASTESELRRVYGGGGAVAGRGVV